MKHPTFLVVMSSLLAMSFAANGMQTLEDGELSLQSGQNGVTLRSDLNISSSALRIRDNDGFAGYASAGQLIQRGLGYRTCVETTASTACTATTNASGYTMVMDAGASGVNGLLSIGITTSPKIRLFLTSVDLGNGSATAATVTPKLVVINPGSSLVADKYIELVAAPSSEIRMDIGKDPKGGAGKLTFNSLRIASMSVNGGLALVDAGCSTCGYGVSSYTLTGAGGGVADLSGTYMNVSATNGLVLTLGSAVVLDATMGGLRIGDLAGSSPAVGSLTIKGLDLSGLVVTLKGH